MGDIHGYRGWKITIGKFDGDLKEAIEVTDAEQIAKAKAEVAEVGDFFVKYAWTKDRVCAIQKAEEQHGRSSF